MGGYSILLRGRTLDYGPKRLMDDVPPETVSTLFTNGKLFDCNSEVVLVGAYVSNDPKIYVKHLATLGRTQLETISNYIYKHRREGREVFFFGDLNAYTLSAAGWDCAESLQFRLRSR